MILVDTNALLDIYKADPIGMPWSLTRLRSTKAGQLAINMVVYAELAGHPSEPAHLDQFVETVGLQLLDLSRPAARLAGVAFRQYRQRGGTRTGVPPDFFIGAHAQANGFRLLSRDAGRYKTYFPKIKLISPCPLSRNPMNARITQGLKKGLIRFEDEDKHLVHTEQKNAATTTTPRRKCTRKHSLTRSWGTPFLPLAVQVQIASEIASIKAHTQTLRHQAQDLFGAGQATHRSPDIGR